ncbi:MAG TPA: hypothetical protein PKW90_16970 [Myxococcota bacterium]|nr:hypothetical protein [Myxococcota bacterium]
MWWLLACQPGFLSVEGRVEESAAAPDSPAPAEPLPLCINEWMPENHGAWVREDASSPDWVELHNPTAERVPLEGWQLGELALSGELEPGGFLLLPLEESALDADQGELTLIGPGGRSQVRWERVPEDFSVARQTDCCVEEGCLALDFRGSPGVSNLPEPEAERVELLPKGSVWRYLDSGVYPGNTWMQADFDDTSWKSGPGPLGYGDAQVSILDYGTDPNNKPAAAWFRRDFVLNGDRRPAALNLWLMRDDSALVYLNGTEIYRYHLPEGAIDASTLATASVSSPDEAAHWRVELPADALQVGANQLAVEVHQASVSSSDLSFDLGVDVEFPP